MVLLLSLLQSFYQHTCSAKSTIRCPYEIGLIVLKRRNTVLSGQLSFEHVEELSFLMDCSCHVCSIKPGVW